MYDGKDPISQLVGANKFSKAAQIKVDYQLEKLNVVLNYTLSKTLVRADSINSGLSYPSYSDRPHLFNLGLNIKLSDRWTFSLKQYVQSGRPLTLLFSEKWLFISNRNEARLPMYHRLDLSINRSVKRPNNKVGSTFSFSVYNAYNHRNIYYLEKKFNSPSEYTAVSLFPIIPTISYKLDF